MIVVGLVILLGQVGGFVKVFVVGALPVQPLVMSVMEKLL